MSKFDKRELWECRGCGEETWLDINQYPDLIHRVHPGVGINKSTTAWMDCPGSDWYRKIALDNPN